MLPASEEVHGCRVDFLHRAQAVTRHFRAGHEGRTRRAVGASRGDAIGNRRQEPATQAAIKRLDAAELVVVLGVLAEEDGSAERAPATLDTTLQVPDIRVIAGARTDQTTEAGTTREEPGGRLCVFILVQAIDEQA